MCKGKKRLFVGLFLIAMLAVVSIGGWTIGKSLKHSAPQMDEDRADSHIIDLPDYTPPTSETV